MSGPGGLPPVLRALLARVVPEERHDEVLADLEASYRARAARLGERAARRHLWREAAALVLWRVGRRRGGGTRVAGSEGLAGRAGPGALARDLLRDVRFGARTLARRPGFTLAAVGVLGLGIGAPATVLTLVSRIFHERPPHVEEPHRLVRVWRSWAPGQGGGSLSHPDFAYYRENVGTLEGLAAWGGEVTAAYSLDGAGTDQLVAGFVSDNWFDVLGTRPAAGRFFRADENAEPGEAAVLVASHGFARRALGGAAAAVGRSVAVGGIPFTVVGVAPEGFRGLSATSGVPDAWVPIAMFGALTRAPDRAWWERVPNLRFTWLSVAGRLAPGVTFEAAEANLQALSASLDYAGRDEAEGLLVSREALFSPAQATNLSNLFRMLLAVVLSVLAIATANVAVLQLSRATTRTREMGIRAALGAGRGRLFRQLLVESLLLGAAGGALGVALAWALSGTAASLLPYAFVVDFTPDVRVLLAAAGLALGTAVLAGLAPALHAARRRLPSAGEGARAASGRSRVRDALVVGQVALSLMLVAGALLFARSFWSARTQDLGFATEDRLVLQVDLRALGHSQEEGLVFVRRALERLRGMPGVVGATTSRQIPFGGDWSTELQPPDGALPNTEDGRIWLGLNTVSPDYFEVVGTPLVRGRGPTAGDGADGAPVVVVNETLAALLWPGEDPLGRTIDLRGDAPFTVVGVARDATYYELGEAATTQAWGSLAQVYQPLVHFVIHARGPATDMAAPAQAALRELEPRLAFGEVTTLEAVFEEETARYQVTAALVGLFGALALVLAAAGLYAVVSFLVARRTRDIGVRMALGADRGRVAAEVVRTGLVLAGVGVALGLGGAVALRRLTESLLYGVAPEDPWALAGACAALLAVAAFASAGPARRATRVDPVQAMRTE